MSKQNDVDRSGTWGPMIHDLSREFEEGETIIAGSRTWVFENGQLQEKEDDY